MPLTGSGCNPFSLSVKYTNLEKIGDDEPVDWSIVDDSQKSSIREVALNSPVGEISECDEFVDRVGTALGIPPGSTPCFPFTRDIFQNEVRPVLPSGASFET